MQDKTVNLNLDLNAPPVILHVTQGDTAWRWHFCLFLDGSRWSIPTGAQIILKGLKPDGHVFAFSGEISSNEAIVTSALQMTICAGEVPCSLIILDADAKRLAFGRITMYVAADAEGQFDVASESALPAYAELLSQYGDIVPAAAQTRAAAAEALASKNAAASSASSAAVSATDAAGSATAAGNAKTAAEAAQTAAVAAKTATETTRDTAISTLQTEGAAQKTEIQQKGAEVIASIPEDYTDLTKDVHDLKSALYYEKQGTSDNFFSSYVNTKGSFSNSTKTIVNGRPYNFTYDHVKSIKCQEGYSFVVYGYDMSFEYLGNLISDGTFDTSASGAARYTEFDLEDYPDVLFRFGLSHVVSGSPVDITADEANVFTLTYMHNKALANRRLSVIGDSISTFTGYTNPNAPTAYYPNTRAALRVVDQMYWKALAERNGMTIDTIDSYGGSTVGTNWNGDVNYTPFTDESRLSRLGDPDFIIVEGGINDFGGNPLGNYPTDNAYSNMYEFRTSYAYLLHQLKTRYPYARIVCMSMLTPKTYNNTQFPEKQTEVKQALSSDNTPHYLYEFNDTIKELCARYGCIYCNIYDIVNYYVATTSELGPHPFASGHYFIANRLEAVLKDSGV